MTISSLYKEIEKKALNLPIGEKELLINSLLVSMDSENISEIDKAWIEEAEKRYRAYKTGLVKGIPKEQLFLEIRQELGWQE